MGGLNGVADASNKVTPAVVHLCARNQGPDGGRSTGAGTIIHEDGFILTCAHLVLEEKDSKYSARKVFVYLQDDKRLLSEKKTKKYEGIIVAAFDIDIAILKIDPTSASLSTAKLGSSSKLRVGEIAIAMGSPSLLQGTVTQGIISSCGRKIEVLNKKTTVECLQTDCAINQGNSGGPICNNKGQVVGVIVCTLKGNAGISFAVPVDHISMTMKRSSSKSWMTVRPHYTGLLLDIDEDNVKQLARICPKFPNAEGGGFVHEIAGLAIATRSPRHLSVSSITPPLHEHGLIAEKLRTAVVYLHARKQDGRKKIGCGTIIHQDSSYGYILTCAHVVLEKACSEYSPREVLVYSEDGEQKYEGIFWVADMDIDIAIIKISPESALLSTANLGSSSELCVGERVIPMRCPSAFWGIISCVDRKSCELKRPGPPKEYIQTNRVIGQGYHGDPLCNIDGEVVGVNVLFKNDKEISFAVPVDLIKERFRGIWDPAPPGSRGVVRHFIEGIDGQFTEIYTFFLNDEEGVSVQEDDFEASSAQAPESFAPIEEHEINGQVTSRESTQGSRLGPMSAINELGSQPQAYDAQNVEWGSRIHDLEKKIEEEMVKKICDLQKKMEDDKRKMEEMVKERTEETRRMKAIVVALLAICIGGVISSHCWHHWFFG